jgi:hypothetical protein
MFYSAPSASNRARSSGLGIAAKFATEYLDLGFEEPDANIATSCIRFNQEMWKDVEPTKHGVQTSIENQQNRNNEGLSTFWTRAGARTNVGGGGELMTAYPITNHTMMSSAECSGNAVVFA